MDNLNVIGYEIKIWGVRLIIPSGTTGVSKDFNKVYEMVEEMFNIGGITGSTIPPDFEDLMNKLFKFRYFI